MNVQRTTQIPRNWGLQLTHRQTFDDLTRFTNGEEGVLTVTEGDGVGFTSIADLRTAAEADGAPEALKQLIECFKRAQRVSRNGYDASTDLILGFLGDGGPQERLASGASKRVRAWWLKPGRRSIKKINLLESDELVSYYAFDVQEVK